jgi:hypothetical protein
MDKATNWLNDWFRALIEGGECPRATADFLEDGLSYDEYITQEKAIFQALAERYGLKQGWLLSVASAPMEVGETLEVQLVNKDGLLAYEWPYSFRAGEACGNQSYVQIVTKCQTINGGAAHRAFAIDSRHQPFVWLTVCESHDVIQNVTKSADGEFDTFAFALKNDTFDSRWVRIRSRWAQMTESRWVWLRGFDRPGFKYPKIKMSEDGVTWDVPLAWSVAYRKRDGESVFVEFPHTQAINVKKSELEWLCLTDAYDHDWIWTWK